MRNIKLKLTFAHKLAIILALVSFVSDLSFPRLAQAQAPLSKSGEETVIVIGRLPLANFRPASKSVKVILTAYSSTPDQTDQTPFITSNGTYVYDGLIAANWLSYGSRVKFPELFGAKVFTVNDRMHPRYGAGRVDLWLDAPLEEVKEFGVKRVVMEIY